MSDRNAQSHFNAIEIPNVKRSMFPLLFHNIGTCNTGVIVPFLAYSDILPGDTMKATTTAIIRMQTPLNPTMDGLVYDTYYFAVPHRLVWDHWKEFMGECANAAWETSTEYTVPMINAPASTGITKGTIADYMGLPKGVTGISYQALPFRAYTLIYNTWFRNQNLIAPVQLHTDDTTRNGDNSVTELGGAPFKAGKLADYFTTCLPAPQRALPGMTQGMSIPLGTIAPVITGTELNQSEFLARKNASEPIRFRYTDNGLHSTGSVGLGMSNTGALFSTGGTSLDTHPTAPSNLIADLTNATAATINALRLAFQVQKLQELWARGGVRYFEILKNEFGAHPNMSVLQYPEYLGGTRDAIALNEVVQTSTSGSTSTDQLGWTGGTSHTVGQNQDFTKTFLEHTILIGLLVIRQQGHLYQQSLPKMWSREKKLDYYTPTLAHLGEQPVYKKEIMATGISATDNAVFGYQERWAEYKYGRETTSGEMSSSYATSLDVWHYGDWYASVPTLAQNWFEETDEYVDRTLAVSSAVADQFKFDIVTNIVATRPMPVYCTPGLIDHF